MAVAENQIMGLDRTVDRKIALHMVDSALIPDIPSGTPVPLRNYF